jgi:hypothetical protein
MFTQVNLAQMSFSQNELIFLAKMGDARDNYLIRIPLKNAPDFLLNSNMAIECLLKLLSNEYKVVFIFKFL